MSTGEREIQLSENREAGTREEIVEVNKVLAKVVKRETGLKKLIYESTRSKVAIKQVARELDLVVENLERNVKKYEGKHIFFSQ